MSETNQQTDSLRDVKDIRQMMERSSRFISLSGLSGVSAGVFALAGAAIARLYVLQDHYIVYNNRGQFIGVEFDDLKFKLLALAAAVFAAAFLSAFYFTWRKSSKQGVAIWNPTSRRLFWNMMIPVIAGALFILGMLRYDDWSYVAPASLVFYGLALVNASKYTLTDIRYLGYFEILTGLLNLQWPGEGLYFWAAGFGILHIIYGIVMWWKYERNS